MAGAWQDLRLRFISLLVPAIPSAANQKGTLSPQPPKVIAADLTGCTDAPNRPTSAWGILVQQQMRRISSAIRRSVKCS